MYSKILVVLDLLHCFSLQLKRRPVHCDPFPWVFWVPLCSPGGVKDSEFTDFESRVVGGTPSKASILSLHHVLQCLCRLMEVFANGDGYGVVDPVCLEQWAKKYRRSGDVSDRAK